jgi:hypothetical protein
LTRKTKMNKGLKKYFLPLLLIFALSACNLQLVEGTQGEGDALLLTITAQAQLLEQGGLTFTPIAAQNQAIVYITATADGSALAPPEVVIPAAVLPPATGPVTVTVSVATNCRQGPGTAFASVYGMPVEQVAKVIAKNTTTGYWIIEIPGQNGQSCWLWGQYATVTGDTASLNNVVTPTSAPRTVTPTKATTATVTANKQSTTTATITSTVASGAIAGCTDSTASNYNSAATVNDGSCTYVGQAFVGGCTDPNATNYNPNANADDGSCTYATLPNAPDFNALSCSVTGPDANGNYTFNYTTSWVDKSNNEKGFTVTAPEGIFTYPANTTAHTGTFTQSKSSETMEVFVSVFNNVGSVSMPMPPLVTLLCQ